MKFKADPIAMQVIRNSLDPLKEENLASVKVEA